MTISILDKLLKFHRNFIMRRFSYVDPKEVALQKIVMGLTKQVEGYAMMGDSLNEFSLRLLDLVTEAVPEYVDVIEHVTNVYDDVVQLRYDYGKILKRVSEDIRDIYERGLAIKRFQTEYENNEKLLMKAQLDLHKSKGKVTEASNKEKAKLALKNTKDSLATLIDQKTRYGLFINKRLSHAISFYTVALAKSTLKEANLMKQAALLFQNEAIEKVENRMYFGDE
ncbi:hypothetical protein TRFO_29630 [Tritrichomonas foetus]|uniref:Sorting nexin/Vps5-like C-terminal domain-containing protein n=1 Tax=Tritrichomonas foetus TaxID=1144522 RepID=A0A1J4JZW2_9EUKA|nr:hypothetical protein TRFO_29630 [Tritrichomonas foetus]|eukprot:OHT03068.1 hypothetical protein TRFO_29630 [Tritrichomonas foetus]